jgi:hypothetical protein
METRTPRKAMELTPRTARVKYSARTTLLSPDTELLPVSIVTAKLTLLSPIAVTLSRSARPKNIASVTLLAFEVKKAAMTISENDTDAKFETAL